MGKRVNRVTINGDNNVVHIVGDRYDRYDRYHRYDDYVDPVRRARVIIALLILIWLAFNWPDQTFAVLAAVGVLIVVYRIVRWVARRTHAAIRRRRTAHDELKARCDVQDEWYRQGDPRGVFGQGG